MQNAAVQIVLVTFLGITFVSQLWSVLFHVSDTPEGIRNLDSYGIGAVTWSLLLVGLVVSSLNAPRNTETHDLSCNSCLGQYLPQTNWIHPNYHSVGTVVAWFCQRDLHLQQLQNAACPRSFGEAQRGQTHRDMG